VSHPDLVFRSKPLALDEIVAALVEVNHMHNWQPGTVTSSPLSLEDLKALSEGSVIMFVEHDTVNIIAREDIREEVEKLLTAYDAGAAVRQ
jgi:hypothetical protein